MKNNKLLFSAFLTLFMLCVATYAGAQEPQYTLAGVMEMQTGETFPYRVVFTEANGNISGHSYTFSPPHETKSVVRGTIDRFAHKISFRETEIVSAKGKPTKAYMCLVNASLVYEKGYRGATLSGPITNRQADKTACTPGTLIFNSSDELQHLFAPKEKFDTVISMKKRIPSKEPAGIKVSSPEVANPPQTTDKITAGIEKSYDWYSDTLVLDIWDGGNTDGDRVSVSLNGKEYLEHYYLVKEKKRLKIPISGTGINSLTIKAVNEGSDPPNTATIVLSDGDRKYNILAYNPAGQTAIIKIKRVK